MNTSFGLQQRLSSSCQSQLALNEKALVKQSLAKVVNFILRKIFPGLRDAYKIIRFYSSKTLLNRIRN